VAAAAAALVLGLTIASTARAQSDPDAILSRAVVLHQSGDLEGAAALYVQVLRAFPGAARVRSNLGAAYAGLGRYEEAIEQYRRALESIDDVSVRRNLALALQKAGHPREAAEQARAVLDHEPGNRDAEILLAQSHLALGEEQAAVDLLRPVADQAPSDKAVAYLLGTAFLQLGQPEEAQVVMDRVFRDDSPEGHVLLSLLYSKKQDWANSEAEAEKARASQPPVALANYLYGEARLKAFDWQAAAEAFRAELEVNPAHFESNLLLGTLLREEGRTDEALFYLDRAARIRPDDLAVAFSQGAAFVSAGRLEEARRLLERVAAAAPSHVPTRLQLAIVYGRLGETEKAKAAREAAVRLQREAETHPFSAAEGVSDLLARPPGDAETQGPPPSDPR